MSGKITVTALEASISLFGVVMERSNSCARIGGHSDAVDDQTAALVLFVGALRRQPQAWQKTARPRPPRMGIFL
jgi:hypothetical protein